MAMQIRFISRKCLDVGPNLARIAVQAKFLKNNSKLQNFLTPIRNVSNLEKSLTVYRQFDQPEENSKLLNRNTGGVKYLKGLPKSFFFRRRKDDPNKKKRIPKLILVQNPLTWLMIKIDFSVLRNIWDPSFQEKDFKYGTKQAISKVTHVISDGQFEELNGLLTKAARLSLLRELDRNWSDKQRSLLALKREDIQISSPRKVYFIRIADKKYCDVDMAFLALKWAPINSIEALIFTEIFARFHREYTPHSIPEWTIAYFKVTRFEVLRRAEGEDVTNTEFTHIENLSHFRNFKCGNTCTVIGSGLMVLSHFENS